MAIHRNLQIPEDLRRIFNLKTGEFLGNDIAEQIVPVIPVTPVCKIVRNVRADDAASAVIFTTPADRDFYLIAIGISVIKDVLATSVFTRIQVVINGVNRQLMETPGITLTVQNTSRDLCLSPAIKIDRNTSITIINSTAIATISASGYIVGYTVESDPTPQT